MRIRTQRLPTGYRELEYLESTGTQYIDTEANASSSLGLHYRIIDKSGRFGVLGADDNKRHHSYDSSSLYGYYSSGYGSSGFVNVDMTIKVNWLNDKKLDLHTSNYENTWNLSTTTFDTSMTYILFARGYRSQGTINPYWSGRVYYFKMSVGTEIVRNFIPAERCSDNKPGLYDTVNNVFYTNSGTGEFIKGPYKDSYKVNLYPRLPAEYQEVEYIQSNGTQYIDLNIVATSIQRQYIEFGWGSGSPRVLNGSYDKNLTDGSFSGLVYISGHPRLFIYPAASPSIDCGYLPPQDYTKQYYDIDMRGDAYCCNINGTIYIGEQNKNISTTLSMYLLYCHTVDDYYSSQKARGRLFSYKLWQNNNLVRDLVPCYRKADGVIGLYDLVNGTFYTNAGTGSFTKGNNVNSILSCTPKILYAEGTTNLGNTSATYSNKTHGQTINCQAWGGDAGTCTFYRCGGFMNYPYKVYHKTATGSGGIYTKTADDIVIEAGKTYTMSVYVKASRSFTASEYSFNINRGSDNNYINFGTTFNITTQWKRIARTFTATNSQAGNYGEMSIIYDDGVTDYYVYYSGFQIEKKDHATLYTPDTRPDNTIL